jgi:hypothetical protein
MDAAALQTKMAAEIAVIGESLTITKEDDTTFTIVALATVCTVTEAQQYLGSAVVAASTKPVWVLTLDGLQAEYPVKPSSVAYHGETLDVLGVFYQDLAGLTVLVTILAASPAT